MKSTPRACVEVAETLLHEAGFTTSVHQGKHLRLVAVSPEGREGHITIATTPRSDVNCQCNFTRQLTKRLIRSLAA